jgi:hypothetical protein
VDEGNDIQYLLPEGKGLLGLLVDYPQSLRLQDIAQHVASVGYDNLVLVS